MCVLSIEISKCKIFFLISKKASKTSVSREKSKMETKVERRRGSASSQPVSSPKWFIETHGAKEDLAARKKIESRWQERGGWEEGFQRHRTVRSEKQF